MASATFTSAPVSVRPWLTQPGISRDTRHVHAVFILTNTDDKLHGAPILDYISDAFERSTPAVGRKSKVNGTETERPRNPDSPPASRVKSPEVEPVTRRCLQS